MMNTNKASIEILESQCPYGRTQCEVAGGLVLRWLPCKCARALLKKRHLNTHTQRKHTRTNKNTSHIPHRTHITYGITHIMRGTHIRHGDTDRHM